MTPIGRPGSTLQARGGGDEEIAALGPWYHNLHLPDGRVTAPEIWISEPDPAEPSLGRELRSRELEAIFG